MQIIDAHIHYVGDDSEALQLLEAYDLKLLNVAVAHDTSGSWREGTEAFKSLAERHPNRYAWCTTFDPPDFAGDLQDYAQTVTAGLERDFAQGAVACKFWKNIGMSIQKPSGEFLMIDDPLFDPIYEFLASVDKPALMHIGEPLACWLPLDDDNVHAGYYRAHPEWYMGDKPDHPSHPSLMAARDRVLARHPNLKVVGAHLGSLEYDVAEVAARLARYPNFAVDTSARLRDLMVQDPGVVREVFLKYQDRILFGTDTVQRRPTSTMEKEEEAAHLQALRDRYDRELAYYTGERVVSATGEELEGLGLPPAVAEKILCSNARRWYPGL